MKEITSRAFKAQGIIKTQVVSEEVWANIVARGWARKYDVVDMPERKLRDMPVIKAFKKPIEVTEKKLKPSKFIKDHEKFEIKIEKEIKKLEKISNGKNN